MFVDRTDLFGTKKLDGGREAALEPLAIKWLG